MAKNENFKPAPAGQPNTGVNLAGIVITIFIMVVMVAGVLFTVKRILHHFDRKAGEANSRIKASEVNSAVRDSRAYFPSPRQQVTPREDLQTFRAREETELTTYAWINQPAGLVRIPIDRAMDILAAQGLPTRVGTNPGPLGPSSLQLEQARPAQPDATQLTPP